MTPDTDRDPDDGEDVEVRIVDEPEPAGGDIDRRLTALLGRLLDTETRGKVYVHALREPGTTSEEIARGTGLYPETVRRTVADLRAEGVLDRRELEGEEGRYGYTAIPPSELVSRLVGEFQEGLDALLDADGSREDVEPVTIDVEDASGDDGAGDDPIGDVGDGSDRDGEDGGDDEFPGGDR